MSGFIGSVQKAYVFYADMNRNSPDTSRLLEDSHNLSDH